MLGYKSNASNEGKNRFRTKRRISGCQRDEEIGK
jgi:hypothetical protein